MLFTFPVPPETRRLMWNRRMALTPGCSIWINARLVKANANCTGWFVMMIIIVNNNSNNPAVVAEWLEQ